MLRIFFYDYTRIQYIQIHTSAFALLFWVWYHRPIQIWKFWKSFQPRHYPNNFPFHSYFVPASRISKGWQSVCRHTGYPGQNGISFLLQKVCSCWPSLWQGLRYGMHSYDRLWTIRSVCGQKDPAHRSDKEIYSYTEYRSGQRHTLSLAHFEWTTPPQADGVSIRNIFVFSPRAAGNYTQID